MTLYPVLTNCMQIQGRYIEGSSLAAMQIAQSSQRSRKIFFKLRVLADKIHKSKEL